MKFSCPVFSGISIRPQYWNFIGSILLPFLSFQTSSQVEINSAIPDWDFPNAYLDSLAIELKKTKNDTVRVQLMNQIVWRLRQADPERAEWLAKKSYRSASEKEILREKVDALINLGYFDRFRGDYPEALEKYHRALEIEEENGFEELKATTLNNIGVVQYLLGENPSSLEFFQKSLKVKTSLEDTSAMASTLGNIGVLYKKQDDFDAAISKFRKAYRLRKNYGDSQGIAASHLLLGDLFSKIKKQDSALFHYHQALEKFKDLGNKKDLANVKQSIALIHLEQGKVDQAMQELQRVLEVKQGLKDATGIVKAHIALARAYLTKGNVREAIDKAQKANSMARKMGMKSLRKNSLQLLAEGYATQGDFRSAYWHQKQFNALKDSLFDLAKSEKVQNLRLRYENQRKEKEKAKDEAEKKEEALAHQRILGMVAGIGGFFLLLFLFVGWGYIHKRRSNTRLAGQKKEIEEKNKVLLGQYQDLQKQKEEKDVLIKEVHHRVKNNLQVIKSLLNLQSREVDNPEVRKLYNETQNRVRSMALLHEKMYSSPDLTAIDIREYLENLTRELVRTNSIGQQVRLDVNVEGGRFSFGTLTPLGLILNELVINSLKYAFNDQQEGVIGVFLRWEKGRQYRLKVWDNGAPGHRVEKGDKSSLGMELVEALAEQLEGSLESTQTEKGRETIIYFEDIG